jgi:hypothetical protein
MGISSFFFGFSPKQTTVDRATLPRPSRTFPLSPTPLQCFRIRYTDRLGLHAVWGTRPGSDVIGARTHV